MKTKKKDVLILEEEGALYFCLKPSCTSQIRECPFFVFRNRIGGTRYRLPCLISKEPAHLKQTNDCDEHESFIMNHFVVEESIVFEFSFDFAYFNLFKPFPIGIIHDELALHEI